MGEDGLGWPGWDDAVVLEGAIPPNFTEKKVPSCSCFHQKWKNTEMENKLEKYLLCSFFSVSCYLLFNPLPVGNKDKQHNDSATRVNKGTKLLNQTQVNLYECEHFPIGKAEIKNFPGLFVTFL